jgi:hypothetical protein
VGRIVAVKTGDAGKQVLVAFAGQEVAVVQRGAAEIGEQRIPRTIDAHLVAAPHLDSVVEQGDFPKVTIRHAVHPALPLFRVKRDCHGGVPHQTTICGFEAAWLQLDRDDAAACQGCGAAF